MKRKSWFVIASLLLLFTQQMDAQRVNNRGKQARPKMTTEQRIDKQTEIITNMLMLNDATAAKFSALYKKYQQELQSSYEKNRSLRRTAAAAGNQTTADGKTAELNAQKAPLTDAEIEKMLERRFKQSREILDIREKYYKEFKKILQPRQILKVYQTEQRINKRMKHELEQRHKNKAANKNNRTKARNNKTTK